MCLMLEKTTRSATSRLGDPLAEIDILLPIVSGAAMGNGDRDMSNIAPCPRERKG